MHACTIIKCLCLHTDVYMCTLTYKKKNNKFLFSLSLTNSENLVFHVSIYPISVKSFLNYTCISKIVYFTQSDQTVTYINPNHASKEKRIYVLSSRNKSLSTFSDLE